MHQFTVTRVIKRETPDSGWIGECHSSETGAKTLLVNGAVKAAKGDQIICELGRRRAINGVELYEVEQFNKSWSAAISECVAGNDLVRLSQEFPFLNGLLNPISDADFSVDTSGGVVSAKYPTIQAKSVQNLVDRHSGTLAALKAPVKLAFNPRFDMGTDDRLRGVTPSGWTKIVNNVAGSHVLQFLTGPVRSNQISNTDMLYGINFAEGRTTPFVFAQAAAGPGVCTPISPKSIEIYQYFVNAHEYGHSLDPNFKKATKDTSDYDYRKCEAFADSFAVIETANKFGKSAFEDIERIVINREINLVGVMLDQRGVVSMPKENRYMTGMAARAAFDLMKDRLGDPAIKQKKLSGEEAYAAARKIASKNTVTDFGVKKLLNAFQKETGFLARLKKSFHKPEFSIEGLKRFGAGIANAIQSRNRVSSDDLKVVLGKLAGERSLLGRNAAQCLDLSKRGKFALASELTKKQQEIMSNAFAKDIAAVEKAGADGTVEEASVSYMLYDSRRMVPDRSSLPNSNLRKLYSDISNVLETKESDTYKNMPVSDGIVQNLAEDPSQSDLWGKSAADKLSSINLSLSKAYELSAKEHSNPETGFSRFSEFRATMRTVIADMEPLLVDKYGGKTAMDAANVSVLGKSKLSKTLRAIRDLDPKDVEFPLSPKKMEILKGIAKAFGSTHEFGKDRAKKAPQPSNDLTSSESYSMRMI